MPRLSLSNTKRVHPIRLSIRLLLFCVVIIGFTLRVWHVNFDEGLGSHPDERSTSCFYATQIHLPQSWDEFWDPHRSPLNPLWDLGNQKPKSFTYGHYPLYLGVAMGQGMHLLAPVAERLGVDASTVALMARGDGSCDALAVAGRLTIAIHDTLTILLLFLLGLRIFGQGAGLIAATLYAFTAQAIQLSHFFAMDPASTAYTVLAVLGGVMMIQERSLSAAVITGIAAGLAIASKFSALPVLAVPVTAAILVVWREQLQSRAEGRAADARAQLYVLLTLPLIFVLAAVAFFVTSPYAVLDWQSFIQATLVEQGRMVRGIADFPFTRQYRNTTPYLYFIEQQLAWGLWWPLGIVAALGTLYALFRLLYSLIRLLVASFVRATGVPRWQLSDPAAANIVLWSWVLPYFGLTGAFLAKFNRYMSPLLPFVIFFAAGLIWTLWQVGKGSGGVGSDGVASGGVGRDSVKVDDNDDALHVNEEAPTVDAPPVTVVKRKPALQWLTRTVATILAVVGIGGGLFWSLAYVNGVYNTEHTWITASRWIAENVPAGSVILCEQWDDCLPWNVPNEPEVNAANSQLRRIDWGPYEEDTAEKYAVMKAKLREANYVIYSSKRIYDSVDELPERYPMTTRYYAAMFDGTLGFELAKEVTTPPKLFGFVFDDRHADESWSLYDHAQASIFRKVRDLTDAEYDAIFANSWERAIPWYRGADSPLSPLLNRLGLGSTPESEGQGIINRLIAMVTGQQAPTNPTTEDRPSLRTAVPLAELPVVDNYRWNRVASESTLLAIVWWWVVLTLLGWVAWPFAFWIFRPLRDRGYLLSRAFGWLLAGWILWWLASLDLAMNSVWNSWLTVAIVALFGLAAAIWQAKAMRAFLRENWGLLLAGELLFGLAYVGFVFLRMGNPDLWQLWFGGEKFMEFAMLNGILRSPTFPPVDPHFAGGIINYYYFGLYLVAYLIKLTGIYAEVAFNLAIPSLFALTVVNAFAVAYSAVGRANQFWPLASAELLPVTESNTIESSETESSETESSVVEKSVVESNEALAAEATLAPEEIAATEGDDTTESQIGEAEQEYNETVSTLPEEMSAPPSPPHSVLVPPTPAPITWRTGFLTALLAPIFITIIGNLDGMGQMIRNLANMGTSQFQSSLPGLQPLVRSWSGLQNVLTTAQTLPNYDFWGPSRVIPDTINEFPYWSFLFADLHPHLIGIPLALLFLALILTLFRELMTVPRLRWGRGLALLLVFALLLGAQASINLWELPTYLGLGFLALVVAQFRRNGSIRWGMTLGLGIAYLAGAYLLYWPFFSNYVNVGASGVGFVKEGDLPTQWLSIWGFMGFILVSWLCFAATRPATVGEAEKQSTSTGWRTLTNGYLEDSSEQTAALQNDRTPSLLAPVRTGSAKATGVERWLAGATSNFDRLPRFIALHRLLVKEPTLGYLLTSALISLTAIAAVGVWFWGRSVLALCLLPLGLAWLLLWRRGRTADAGSLFVALLTITGLAVLAGTQIIYLKDFLQGGGAYRMNTIFKFFSQVWVIWGVAAAIALPRIWSGFVQRGQGMRIWRGLWATVFVLLFAAGFAYPIWGTPARLDMRFPGWRPDFGTLNGLEFMREGSFTWPDQSNTLDLAYDWAAIQWLLDNVRGNATIVESSQVGYYREAGARIASMTGISGITGMHEGEQRYGEDVGQRGALHREFWETPDLMRMQQLIDELHVDLVYVGPLEQYLHPAAVERLQQLTANGQLTILFSTEKSAIYAVPGRLTQTTEGYYIPTP